MKRKILLSVILTAAAFFLSAVEAVRDSYRVVFHDDLKPEDAKKVSETGVLPGKSQRFQMPESMIFDLKKLHKNAEAGKSKAVFCFKVLSGKDAQRHIGLSADFWYTCYINGKKVATTEPAGEGTGDISPYKGIYKISLKKGENIIAVHTRSGNASWKIACRLMPDVSQWPKKRREQEILFRNSLDVPEKIIGPEVTHLSSNSAVIAYYKEFKEALAVSYWKQGQEQEKKTLADGVVYGRIPQKNLFRFELKNLDAGSEYCYTLRSLERQVTIASGTFRTAPLNGEHTLVAVSDTQTYDEMRESLIRDMVRKGIFKGADLLVSLGDVANSFDNFDRIYFESFLIPFREEGMKAPFYPVRGNHEYRGTDTDRFTDWFGCPYYAFRYGDVFYIVLDTGEDKPRQKVGHTYTLLTDTSNYFKAQREWLRRVIKTKACQTAKFRIVLAHAPPFEWEKQYYAERISSFADCFFGKEPECQIDLWLCGDIHQPYRFDPVTKTLTGAPRKATKRKKCKLTAKDLRDIHFPVYVNDGPGGAGQRYSATRITVRKDSLLLTCTGADGTLMDQIVIRRGKPFEVLKTTFRKYIPYDEKK